MEGIEWSRLIAPLLYVSDLSAMSKLLSACSKPPSTLSGHSFNPLENCSTAKCLKIFARPFCSNRILSLIDWDRRIFKNFSAEGYFRFNEDVALKG